MSQIMTLPMEYRRFGKTEEQISVITLGGMRFKHGWTPPRNHLPKDSIEHCISTTRMALDLGVNHIETAHGYIKSELLSFNMKKLTYLLSFLLLKNNHLNENLKQNIF